MEPDDRKSRRPPAGSAVVVVEALVLGAVVLVGLGQARQSGVCANACQASTPFLVLAAALCLAALAGIVAVRWLARSSLLNEPDRFVTLLASASRHR
jgi:hypothetical protein